MKLEARQRLSASWQQDLNAVRSDKIVQLVKQFSSVVTIKSIGTDGYNEEDSGVAGCEVHFIGKQGGLVGYEPGMSADHVQTMLKIMSTSGVESQLLAGEDSELILILLGDPD